MATFMTGRASLKIHGATTSLYLPSAGWTYLLALASDVAIATALYLPVAVWTMVFRPSVYLGHREPIWVVLILLRSMSKFTAALGMGLLLPGSYGALTTFWGA